MITLDSSALFASMNRKDRDFDRIRVVLVREPRPWLVPAGILAEITYLIERELTLVTLETFLSDLMDGPYTLDCGEEDLPRIRALVRRYADLPLGFADAAVIACAERHGGRVLTLDLRHFGIVVREGTLIVLPE